MAVATRSCLGAGSVRTDYRLYSFMILKLFKFLLIACVLLGSLAIRAQTQEDTRTVKLQVKIWHKFYLDDQKRDKDGNIIRDDPDAISLYYFDGEEPVELELKPGRKSKAFDYRGPSPFVLHKKAGLDANGVPQFQPAIQAKLHRKSNELQIYAFPAKGRKFKAIAIDTSAYTVPANSVMIYNLSPAELMMKIADTAKKIAGYSAQIFPLKGIGDNQIASAQIATQIDGEWERVYRRSWKCPPGSRRVYLMYPVDRDMTAWRSEIIPLD